MKVRLVRLENLSGRKASLYSLYSENEKLTLFESFLKENMENHTSELEDIIMRLGTMARLTGAREQFFKLNEGKPGDGVCALFDQPEHKLRLYCIRFGTTLTVLGGGGFKSRSIRSFQESKKLKKENYLLRMISSKISERIREKEIKFSEDYMHLLGNLSFEIDDYEQ